MRKQKKYLFVLTLGFILTITTNILVGQNLTVKIYNTTGFDINNFTIGTTYIGHISKDSATTYLPFSKFNLDSGYPNESLYGIVNEKRLYEFQWSDCATEWTTETKGVFTYDLTILKREDKDYLMLNFHKQE